MIPKSSLKKCFPIVHSIMSSSHAIYFKLVDDDLHPCVWAWVKKKDYPGQLSLRVHPNNPKFFWVFSCVDFFFIVLLPTHFSIRRGKPHYIHPPQLEPARKIYLLSWNGPSKVVLGFTTLPPSLSLSLSLTHTHTYTCVHTQTHNFLPVSRSVRESLPALSMPLCHHQYAQSPSSNGSGR